MNEVKNISNALDEVNTRLEFAIELVKAVQRAQELDEEINGINYPVALYAACLHLEGIQKEIGQLNDKLAAL